MGLVRLLSCFLAKHLPSSINERRNRSIELGTHSSNLQYKFYSSEEPRYRRQDTGVDSNGGTEDAGGWVQCLPTYLDT